MPQSDVDYWFGGVVAGGVTPQLGWSWTDNTSAVANIKSWMDRCACPHPHLPPRSLLHTH